MSKKDAALLFLGKPNDAHVEQALQFCQMNFTDVTVCLGNWGDPLPDAVQSWQGDYIISYLSRWVIPAEILHKASQAAINFHPASPDYPGVGCNNFALYENAQEYGVTCHHMASQVDTGSLIAVRRFPVFASDDVASLLARTYAHQLVLFYEIMSLILREQPLPTCPENWTRKPFTRKDLRELARITPEMSQSEIQRRIRALRFENWRPEITIQGFVFQLKAD